MRFLLCLFLLLATPAMAASDMVGVWFGHGQPGDDGAMYIDRLMPDGIWRGEYRTCLKGKSYDDQVQMGHWSFSGNMLSLKVETVNGVPSPRTDTYRMMFHDATTQKYLSQGMNFPYTPRRMPNDFQMPACDLIS
jgi:hypothetical protein